MPDRLPESMDTTSIKVPLTAAAYPNVGKRRRSRPIPAAQHITAGQPVKLKTRREPLMDRYMWAALGTTILLLGVGLLAAYGLVLVLEDIGWRP